MLLLIFATPLEARSTIEQLHAEPISNNAWSFDRGEILITGMGIMQCAMALFGHIGVSRRFQKIWQLGFAATLRDLPLGTICEIGQMLRLVPFDRCDPISLRLFEEAFPTLDMMRGGKILITVDAPLHDDSRRADLAKVADLLDMEGYALAAVSKRLEIPARAIKVTSDPAGEGGRAHLQQNASLLSEMLAQWIQEQL